MRSKHFKMTGTAMLLALILIAGFVIGYIRLGTVEMTWIAVPVVIGTLALGLRSGVILAFAFAVTSLVQIWIPGSWLGLQLINISVLKTVMIVFVPRLLIPFVTYGVYKLLTSKYDIYIQLGLFLLFGAIALSDVNSRWFYLIPAVLIASGVAFFRKDKSRRINYAIACMFGSMTNTLFFLGGVYVLFLGEPAFKTVAEQMGTSLSAIGAFLTGVALSNGIPEAILAFVLGGAILLVLDTMGYVAVSENKIKNEEQE
ncbi:MAG: ECF transporter S component [Eubacteriales bacterium]